MTDTDTQEKQVAETAAPEKAEEAPVEVPAKFKKFIDDIEGLSVLDLHELVKTLEKRFGVSAAAVAVSAPGAGAEAVAEESSTVNVELTDAGAQKIAVIKAIKEAMGLGLKEAKDLVDGAPSMLKQGLKREEGEELKKKIEEAGGKVTFK